MAHGHEAVWRAIGVTPTHPAFIQEQAGPESLRGLHAGPPTHRYAQVFRVSPAWGRGGHSHSLLSTLLSCSDTITGSWGKGEVASETYPLGLPCPPFWESELPVRIFTGRILELGPPTGCASNGGASRGMEAKWEGHPG